MTQHRNQSTFTALRLVTQRISSSPSQRLPYIVSSLATTLNKSQDSFLDAQSDSETRKLSDGPVLIHKLKTQISALLQDRSPAARYSAVVLIKAIVEVGGQSILQGSLPWIKNLTSLIGSTYPEIIKRLCVIVLTRIFVLTHRYPSLVREVTTPCLGGFITVCLNLINERKTEASNEVLLAVMEAFAELITRHSTVFRPFNAQIRALCLPRLAPTPSSIQATDDSLFPPSPVSQNSRRLYVQLSFSAPKNAFPETWAKNLSDMIDTLHRTANLVFRALIEDFTVSPTVQNLTDRIDFDDPIQDYQSNELGLAPWVGINAGIERLDGLLLTLGTFVSSPSPVALVIPVGRLVEAIERMLSALPPTRNKVVRTRPESSREERESLFVGLPHLHVSTINLSFILLARMGFDATAVSFPLLDQILWTLDRETDVHEVRAAAYRVIAQILDLFGASLPQSCIPGLSTCLRRCCEDVLPLTALSSMKDGASMTKTQNGANDKSTAISHDSKITNGQVGISRCPAETRLAAVDLLSSALMHLPQAFVSSSLRQQVDRVAIISNNKDIMFASTMNPPIDPTKSTLTSSLMPFLARSYPDHLEVEALLRPRMPLLQVRQSDQPGLASNDEEAAQPHDDLNDFAHNDPEAKEPYSNPIPTESKRQRQSSDDNGNGSRAGEDGFFRIDATDSSLPSSPKRQKLAHREEADATLTSPSMIIQPVEHADHLEEQHLGDGDVLKDPVAEAAEAEPSFESKPPPPPVSRIPYSKPEPPTLMQGVKTGFDNEGDDDDDDDDSENFVIPALEMDSDSEEEEDDEDEQDKKGGAKEAGGGE